jgi:O-antigen ligase
MFRPSVFQQYAPEPERVHDVHSVYFEVMGEHGFIGFGIFMMIMAFTWLKGSSIIRFTKRNPELKWARDLAAMTQVSMIGYATCGAFLGLSYFDLYWHLVAIMVILDHLVKEQQGVKPADQGREPVTMRHVATKASNFARDISSNKLTSFTRSSFVRLTGVGARA